MDLMRILRWALILTTMTSVGFGLDRTGGRVKGQLLVQHRKAANLASVYQTVAVHGAKVTSRIQAVDVLVLEVAEPALESVRRALARSGKFTFVEPNYVAELSVEPNDPQYAYQWHLPKVAAPEAWSLTTGSSGVPIAVIDSGVDSQHLDLSAKVLAGWNFLNNTSDTSDVHGHGTATAGTAAAATNNRTGVAGAGWSNPIMPLVAVNSSGWASYSNIAAAITYAAGHGVRVISISIAGTSPSGTLQAAVNYAWKKRAVVFAAAGNASTSAPYYPAACDKVVAVGSTGKSDTKSSFSNYGNWISLTAPGESILTTTRGGGYTYKSGTSFSAPLTAGVAALVLAANPGLSAGELVNLLQSTADDLGSPGFDNYYGWGRVNAYGAVSESTGGPSDNEPPSVSITSPASGSVSGAISVTVTASDNAGVTRVDLYANGQFVSLDTSPPYALPYDTTQVDNGDLTFTAKAYDTADNMGSDSVTVIVDNAPAPDPAPAPADTQKPSVKISSPADGGSVRKSARIKASATDNAAVTKMALIIDGAPVYQSNTSSFTYRWRPSKGPRTITVRAWDAAGNKGEHTIHVTRTK